MEAVPAVVWLSVILNWGGLAVAVGVIKRDIHWITKWCAEHQARDDAQFKKIEQHQEDWERETRTQLNTLVSRPSK